ncbi:MAG: histidine--tRNA ligase [Hyphomicrobiaceae bacterium]|nr:histidine--tRNA ligase [Hyphomicrobiaceae bacterium]
MAKNAKTPKPKARLPKGFADIGADDVRQTRQMLAKIAEVYESYGFEPLETPAFEYTDALGKFLPDTDRPNAGVFSMQDEDEQWMSLRYDMTAPLARHVAQNYQHLTKPFRRYAFGPVWRNEKPGPGRFRQFTQFDADTVGTSNVAADAEICMLAADTMEALGIARGQYVIRVSHRGLLDGVLQSIGLAGEDAAERKLVVLRAIDKLDRLGPEGVRALLGKGRKDESGDFTSGAELAEEAIAAVMAFVETPLDVAGQPAVAGDAYAAALADLRKISDLCASSGFAADRIKIDQTVVRGLDYYTGPVFEAELTFEITDEDGRPVRFGSVGGGGRYDDLVARFTGQQVPATGFSIGVSRLQAALNALGKFGKTAVLPPVVVLVMDFDDQARFQKMVRDLREAGVRAEMYLGTSGLKAQMKYADKRGAPCVIIQGGDERAAGQVQIKDLIEGQRLSEGISDAKEWRETRPAQFSVPEADMVAAVKDVLARHTA